MRDRIPIYSGLAIFLALMTFPAWHNLSARVSAKGPEVRLPVREKQCVASREYMRASHMDLLLGWREKVVRTGVRDYVAPGGTHYNMSLTPTCLEQCHAGQSRFLRPLPHLRGRLAFLLGLPPR